MIGPNTIHNPDPNHATTDAAVDASPRSTSPIVTTLLPMR